MKVSRLTVVALFMGLLFGLVQTLYAEDNLRIYAGVNIYGNPELDSVSLVDFNFSLERNDFEFFSDTEEDSLLYARIFAQVDLIDASGYVIDSASTYFSVAVSNSDEATQPGMRLFNRLSLLVKPGLYSARLTIIDAVDKSEGELFFDNVEVVPVSRKKLIVSDLLLGYKMSRYEEGKSTGSYRLVKNGLYFVHNPNGAFNEKDTLAYLYAEIYNLQFDESSNKEYSLDFSIVDANDKLIRSLGHKTVEKAGNSAVIREAIDIEGWSPQTYYLKVVATDLENSMKASNQIALTILSSQTLFIGSTTLSQVDPYDKLTIKQKVEMVEYLLTPVQLQTLTNLTDVGKENFLDQFWRENDANPATSVLENRLETLQRFIYANEYFSTNDGGDNGWRSDQGRIYIIYGPWDERDVISSPRVGDPFEIWHYRMLKEGKYFVFEDWSGTLEYRLVHANVPGEVYNQEWEVKINEELLEIY